MSALANRHDHSAPMSDSDHDDDYDQNSSVTQQNEVCSDGLFAGHFPDCLLLRLEYDAQSQRRRFQTSSSFVLILCRW